ncbi:acyl-CoA dehydrogenase family protein [Nocardia vaccinii]|uniref:acyl-CoA dehydrogenase family protein n=1 Tax=Nocardia vaccinii TaxID=1822 RepID=UPI00082B21E8|nr:acyl-CoA dehydrogenase family protein [Nocardia vaccinii]
MAANTTSLFVLTDDQQDLKAYLSSYMKASGTTPARDRLAGKNVDETGWQLLVDQLGLHALLVPEELGGAGGNAVHLTVVCEQMGAALNTTPFLSSAVIAAELLTGAGERARPHLEQLLVGKRYAVAVIDAPAPSIDGRTGTVSGLASDLPLVLDGMGADALLIAYGADRGAILCVNFADAGAERTPTASLDPSRAVAAVNLRDTTAEVLSSGSEALAATRRALQFARLAVSAEAVGGMAALVDRTSSYVRERHQFGYPVGMFQGVKHRLADMHVRLEGARSAVAYAAHLVDLAELEAAHYIDLAFAFACDSYVQTAFDAIQMHGGLGFTWEHDAHLFLRRARVSAALFGGTRAARGRLTATLSERREMGPM